MKPQTMLMDAPMLKRRLNPFLLVSTVLILSLLAGLSVFYQGSLNDRSNQIGELRQELQSRDERIQQLQQEKSNVSRTLRQKNDRITNLESLLASKREEVDQLSQRITTLESQLEEASSTSNATLHVNNTLGRICGDGETTLSSDAEILCQSEGHDTS